MGEPGGYGSCVREVFADPDIQALEAESDAIIKSSRIRTLYTRASDRMAGQGA